MMSNVRGRGPTEEHVMTNDNGGQQGQDSGEQKPQRWKLVVAAVLAGVAVPMAGVPFLPVFVRLIVAGVFTGLALYLVESVEPWFRPTVRVLSLFIVVLGVGFLAMRGLHAWQTPDPCAPPTTVAVVTSPDLAGTVSALAAGYERASLWGHGCPKVTLHVTVAPRSLTVAGFRQGWGSDA
jgi:hypothetical protein